MNKNLAYRTVRNAIKSGLLIRPDYCESCGLNPGLGRDGRALIHAHHHRGYGAPLDVQWLCARCHRQETPLPIAEKNGSHTHPESRRRGEENGQSKLTAAEVAFIKTSPLPQRTLAKMFGVTKTPVAQIKQGKAWKHIAASPYREKPND